MCQGQTDTYGTIAAIVGKGNVYVHTLSYETKMHLNMYILQLCYCVSLDQQHSRLLLSDYRYGLQIDYKYRLIFKKHAKHWTKMSHK